MTPSTFQTITITRDQRNVLARLASYGRPDPNPFASGVLGAIVNAWDNAEARINADARSAIRGDASRVQPLRNEGEITGEMWGAFSPSPPCEVER